jgi:hypothetical protein
MKSFVRHRRQMAVTVPLSSTVTVEWAGDRPFIFRSFRQVRSRRKEAICLWASSPEIPPCIMSSSGRLCRLAGLQEKGWKCAMTRGCGLSLRQRTQRMFKWIFNRARSEGSWPLSHQGWSALPIRKRALKGIEWGLQTAAGFALFAVLARVVGGSEVFEGDGLSFPQTLAAEFGAGIVGGLVFGLSLPMLTSSVRIWFIGLVIGAICGFAFLIADKGLTSLTLGQLDILIPFAIVGLAVAIMVRRRLTRQVRP